MDRSSKTKKKRIVTAIPKKTNSLMCDVDVSQRTHRSKLGVEQVKKSKTATKSKKEEKSSSPSPVRLSSKRKPKADQKNNNDVENGRRPEFATRNPDTPSSSQLDGLRGFVKELLDKGVKGLLADYETVKKFNIDPMLCEAHKANPTRNRYKDIFCIDPTRVILEGEDNNYIHANHAKGEPFINDFICAQAPMENTIADFWKMIVQENVGYIIMLCDLFELGKKKCEKYIPEKVDEEKTYGEVTVKLVKSNSIDPQFIMSNVQISTPNGTPRIVFHYQWKEWPDHGVPVTTNASLRALSALRGSTFTALVHCSAGVGRTGTLVAVEWVLQTIMKGEKVDMIKMLKEMRKLRAHAIQTDMQYVYIAQCCLRLWTKVDKEKMFPDRDNETVFLNFCQEMKAANPQAYNPK